ncbi:hypothetical protein FB005_1547 [Sinorhizobium medicae]|nr:hypothetical protein [Sinorhizobium medicae]TWA12140.1 hypothetical protein FB006_1567 [Sinorhizobium medicae]TWA33153.1 hypothetical protein FB005_1547 [Sinorhizobium medicae]
MPALVAMRFNPDLKPKYDPLKVAGKAPKGALTNTDTLGVDLEEIHEPDL